MSELPVHEKAPLVWIDADGAVHIDRRRLGRRQDVDPSLIPLLRGEVPRVTEPSEASDDHQAMVNASQGDGSLSKGLAYSTAFGAVFWAVVAYLFFRWW